MKSIACPISIMGATIPLVLCCVASAQSPRGDSAKAIPKTADTLTTPNLPVVPSNVPDRFDLGRTSEQGNLNEYRIGQLEDDVKKIRQTTDNATGAWWVICGAAGLFVAMIALGHRFLGKYVGIALVEHYKNQGQLAAAPKPPPPAIPAP
jgi:hypothetical protein